MKLLIVIPALNEEASIQSIIERSLAAKWHIFSHSPVTKIDITVVSDGSTDRTVELASRYQDQIRLIVFEKNRGYGAAIQTAWQESDAELLAFLDADGTCEPKFFADLCETLVKEKADLVLGCRLNKGTKMPLIRQTGNFIFAALLTLFSRRRVRDTASGMRVVRRETYERLRPLPNGLHFTPAMSARAMLGAGGRTKLVEIDMPYHEREGVSKLNVVKDGLRFFRIITETAFLYQPGRILSQVAMLFLVIALLLGFGVIPGNSLHHRTDWALSGITFGCAAFFFALLLFSTGSAMQQLADVTIGGGGRSTGFSTWIYRVYKSRFFWIIPSLLAGGALANLGGMWRPDFLAYVPGDLFPSVLIPSFLLVTAVILVMGRIFAFFLDLLRNQIAYTRQQDSSAETPAAAIEDIALMGQ